MDGSNSTSANLHVAILSSPGMGHLIPVVLLSNRLATHHGATVTVLLVTTTVSPPESNLLKIPLHPLVNILELPPADISHLVNSSAKIVTQLCLMVRVSLPSIRSAMMSRRPHALFADLFCTEALPIAAEFNIPNYVYIPSNAWFTALLAYSPILHQQYSEEYVNQTDPIPIPGCKPVRPEDLNDPMLDQKDQQYDEYLKIGENIPSADGILINSWADLEPETLRAFAENRSVIKIPVHPVGPLVRESEPDHRSSELVQWLDRQPDESVVLASFGSGGVLSQQQMTELAWGLENSRQRFVWVVRRPTGGPVDNAFLRVTNGEDSTPDYLPEGFLTRTKEQGFLVSNWAPQAEILGHPAVGGFVTHCGWNSTLESIASGAPLIAWPLYAEQKMNAALLAEEVGVALRPRALPTSEVVGREEIEAMVRELMEGEEGGRLREKAKQLKKSGAEALKRGGPSYTSICDLLAKIASRNTVIS
ncbi:anthocyanidin 3-O-glucosyltransferase 5-like [Salvia hispanica]|uniref:anthocyanidin 3-O-glucosyltransferase 5-like n=1 Tax=Salvia hispanica TaxID=49212 RepID=UPI00200919BA|nr:anthocyanidin 3-O-glucosyltransferase 5-like [Salvia hispanica]